MAHIPLEIDLDTYKMLKSSADENCEDVSVHILRRARQNYTSEEARILICDLVEQLAGEIELEYKDMDERTEAKDEIIADVIKYMRYGE